MCEICGSHGGMKITDSWDATPCSFVDGLPISASEGPTSGNLYNEDRGSRFLRKGGTHLQNYTTSYSLTIATLNRAIFPSLGSVIITGHICRSQIWICNKLIWRSAILIYAKNVLRKHVLRPPQSCFTACRVFPMRRRETEIMVYSIAWLHLSRTLTTASWTVNCLL
jgi:hypothetical protein